MYVLHLSISVVVVAIVVCIIVSFMCKQPVSEHQGYPNVCDLGPDKSWVTGKKLTCTELQQHGCA